MRWRGRLKGLAAKPDNLNWRGLVPTQLSSDLHKHAMRLVLPTRIQNKNSGACVKGIETYAKASLSPWRVEESPDYSVMEAEDEF